MLVAFLLSVAKYLTKINLRRREFVWLTVLGHTVHRGGEGMEQACEVAVVMVSIARKQREVNLVLSFSIQSVPQSHPEVCLFVIFKSSQVDRED